VFCGRHLAKLRRANIDAACGVICGPIGCVFGSNGFVLLRALRRIGIHDTEFAQATSSTIRVKLLKIGALVRISVRRISAKLGPRRHPARNHSLAHGAPTNHREVAQLNLFRS
jgi:hypothetical protein